MVSMSLIEALPRDVRFYLASFLEPHNFRSLCLTCNIFGALGRDQNFFAFWYRLEFMQHVREKTPADVVEKAFIQDSAQIRKRCTKVFASAEQISSLLELKLEPGCTWSRLFVALYFTKQGMLKEMQHCRGFTNDMDEDENVSSPSFGGLDAPFVIYETGKIIDDVSLISCGSIMPRRLARGYDLYFIDDAGFSPDFTSKEERVLMDELNLFTRCS
jgi:hypothetical protein